MVYVLNINGYKLVYHVKACAEIFQQILGGTILEIAA